MNRNGTMAEYLTLPASNLHPVPSDMPNEVAVFAEPLAAACRIVEQGLVSYTNEKPDRVAILGDGKLGLMIAEVLGREHKVHFKDDDEARPVLFGKHQHKLDLVNNVVKTRLVSEAQDATAFNGVSSEHAASYDVVVEATGSPSGLSLATGLLRPMGTLVLKSTCAIGEKFNPAPIVIDELKVVGSRCGPIDKAISLLQQAEPPLNVQKYITKTFPLSQADQAIKCAAEKSTMKVQIICCSEP
jgi:threonine dehydrogenase-like Zn-dependent dehydrogenase